MRTTDLQELLDYNTWANERILAAASTLTTEQFAAPTRFPRGSLQGCLIHILAAVRFHLANWQELPPPTDNTAEVFPDVATLAAGWHRAEADLRAYLAPLTDADLDQPRSITFADDGVRVTAPLWKLVAHLVNHGTQHRSDAAQMLTELGHSPGDLDLMDMLPVTPV